MWIETDHELLNTDYMRAIWYERLSNDTWGLFCKTTDMDEEGEGRNIFHGTADEVKQCWIALRHEFKVSMKFAINFNAHE